MNREMGHLNAFTGRTIENRIYYYSGKGMMIENDQIDR